MIYYIILYYIILYYIILYIHIYNTFSNILNFCMCYHCRRCIQTPVKHLRWSLLLKVVNYFRKKFYLDVWLVSENASECYHCVLPYLPI